MTTRCDKQSRRSASCDEARSAAPFSINESDLLGNEFDSAHASIADWVDFFGQGGSVERHDDNHAVNTSSQFAPDLLNVTIAPMADMSVIDPLNVGFINEPSMEVNAPGLIEIKTNFEGLEVQSFSITELLEKNKGKLGRRTHTVEKPYLQTRRSPSPGTQDCCRDAAKE